jgi:nucleotide-binding universal stress UspA family protein
MNGEYRRVVAGVSSVVCRLPMIRWAADEAAERGAELRLVTAVPRRAVPEHHLRASARDRLTRAAKEATARRPGLGISTEVVGGPPADVLRGAAADADLLVVGADEGSFAEAIVGSVPGALLTISPCPLGVVPLAELAARDGAPVLVAVDGAARAALAYAFAAAERSGRALVVLRCLPPSRPREPADREHASAAVAGFDARYPGVAMTQALVAGEPADVLTARSRRAALLVLGSRGHGRLASDAFGSVSRALIHRSGCPVVVTRPRPAADC